MGKRIVVALGGNAISKGKDMDYSSQLENVERTSRSLSKLVEKGYELVITHGNGPQVGNLLLQNDLAKSQVPRRPLDVLTAETQGFIGYMMEQSLMNELARLELEGQVVTLLTRVRVSKDDPAFKKATKPVGSFYTEEESRLLEEEKGYSMVKDSNRGYRRAVFSPRPESILQSRTIKKLVEDGNIVIASGGGGIPVVETGEGYRGIEAVIDKDLTAAKLAEEVDADILMILTDVDQVYINYGSQDQEALAAVKIDQLKAYMEEGHFSEGSVLPKVKGAMEFASQNKEAYICSLDNLLTSLEGKTGTKILK